MFTVSRYRNPLFCQLLCLAVRISFFFIFHDLLTIKTLLLLWCPVTGHHQRQLSPVPFSRGFQHFHQRSVDTLVYLFAALYFCKLWFVVFWNMVFVIYQHQIPWCITALCIRILYHPILLIMVYIPYLPVVQRRLTSQFSTVFPGKANNYHKREQDHGNNAGRLFHTYSPASAPTMYISSALFLVIFSCHNKAPF